MEHAIPHLKGLVCNVEMAPMVAEEDNHGFVVNAFFLQSSDMMTHPIVQPFEVAIILVDVLSDLRMFRSNFGIGTSRKSAWHGAFTVFQILDS